LLNPKKGMNLYVGDLLLKRRFTPSDPMVNWDAGFISRVAIDGRVWLLKHDQAKFDLMHVTPALPNACFTAAG